MIVFWVYHTPMIEPKEIYFLTVFLLVGPLFAWCSLAHHFSRFHSVSVWGDAETNTIDLVAFSNPEFWFLWFLFNLLAQLWTQLLPNIIIMIEENLEFLVLLRDAKHTKRLGGGEVCLAKMLYAGLICGLFAVSIDFQKYIWKSRNT